MELFQRLAEFDERFINERDLAEYCLLVKHFPLIVYVSNDWIAGLSLPGGVYCNGLDATESALTPGDCMEKYLCHFNLSLVITTAKTTTKINPIHSTSRSIVD